MFDYQAGEKYRLTLIMVAAAGLMAGIFFTLLLMPTPAPERKVARQRWMNDPDVMGGQGNYGSSAGAASARMSSSESAPPPQDDSIEAKAAKEMIVSWLPLAWDLSASSARSSQEKAISYMTPEVAATYRQNVWTKDLAEQIEASGVKSSFKTDRVFTGSKQVDGAVVVFVDGIQTLDVPGKGQSARPVKLEYMVKVLPGGMKIVGISEGGQSSS